MSTRIVKYRKNIHHPAVEGNGIDEYTKVMLHFDDDSDPWKDECGNTWTITGSPTLTSDNAVLGKALTGDKKNGILIEKTLIEANRDVSVDAYVTVNVPTNVSGLYYPITLLFNDDKVSFAAFLIEHLSSKLQVGSVYEYFPKGSVQIGERHHFAWSYTHNDKIHYFWVHKTIEHE